MIIERGTTRQDVVFNAGESDRPFRIAGSTALDTKALDLTFTIPPQLLKQLGSVGKQAAQILPEGLPIPLGGTTRAPQLDLNRALTSAVKEGLLPGLLRRATGDKGAAMPADKNQRPGTSEPPPGADPLKDLFDLVGGKKQKDKDKQDQPDRRRQGQ